MQFEQISDLIDKLDNKRISNDSQQKELIL
jgi:hypothetical protein